MRETQCMDGCWLGKAGCDGRLKTRALESKLYQ